MSVISLQTYRKEPWTVPCPKASQAQASGTPWNFLEQTSRGKLDPYGRVSKAWRVWPVWWVTRSVEAWCVGGCDGYKEKKTFLLLNQCVIQYSIWQSLQVKKLYGFCVLAPHVKRGLCNASWYSVTLLLFNYSGWTWIIAWIILLHLIWPQNMTNILAPLEGVCGSRYLWVWCTHPPLNSCPHTGSSMEPSTHADTVPNQLFLVAQSGDLMVMFNVRLNMRTGDR